MAPPPQLSAPGVATYSSNTLTVGDGTWDSARNTFLLPNLVGVNVDTMRYNGMGNRFASASQYHMLILAHGLLAAFAFLLFVPAGVLFARFHTRRPERTIRYHAYCQTIAGILLLAAFIIGNIAVGPARALTNPHHGIGVAILLLFILQLLGGRLVRHIAKSRSIRLKIHRWLGRTIAALGAAQIPLGLTLYGSPLYLFILYAVWMAFLVMLYFILDHRREDRRGDRYRDRGSVRDRDDRDYSTRDSRVTDSALATDLTEKTEPRPQKKSAWSRWLIPLGAGAGVWALSGRRRRDGSRSRGGRSLSRSSVGRSNRLPEVLPSRRGSVYESEYTDSRTERTERTDHTRHAGRDARRNDKGGAGGGGGGGLGRLLLGVGAALGAGKLFSTWADRREDRKREQEYSEVSTATTPTATPRRPRPTRPASEVTTTEDSSVLPASAGAYSSVAPPRRGHDHAPEASRPRSPPRRTSGRRDESRDSWEESELTSSPSRRVEKRGASDAKKKGGVLGALGLGWLAKTFARGGRGSDGDGSSRRHDNDDYSDYDDVRSAARSRYSGRYTGDAPSTVPPRTPSRRRARRKSTAAARASAATAAAAAAPPPSHPPPHPHPHPHSLPVPAAALSALTAARGTETISEMSDTTSMIEQQPVRSRYVGPPMPPLAAGTIPSRATAAAQPQARGRSRSRSPSRSQSREPEHVSMPPMPPDPHGFFYRDEGTTGSVQASSPRTTTTAGRRRSRRRRAGDEAAAAAVVSASILAAEEEERQQQQERRRRVNLRDEPVGPAHPIEEEEHTPSPTSAQKSAVHIKMHVHDDRDRNITFRRMTDEEIAGQARHHRSSSVSSSDADTPSTRRGYRRESNIRRAADESAAQSRVTGDESEVTPTPAQVQKAARRQPNKDSAYYSGPGPGPAQPGQPGPSTGPAPTAAGGLHAHGPEPGTTVSSLATSESHAQDSSAMGSAADRRSRRRQERRRADDSSATRTIDPNDMFN